MEDPVRKVGGGGTAGGDRWEGEDEDEDVKVGPRGVGRGARLGAGGRTRGPGRRPGLRAVWGRERRARRCPAPPVRRPQGLRRAAWSAEPAGRVAGPSPS